MSSRESDPVEGLLRELGESATFADDLQDKGAFFDVFFKIEDLHFSPLGLDLAVTLGILGDWARAYEAVRRYRSLNHSDLGALVFEMRCLYELERYSEVLAIGQIALTEKYHLMTANYLMGLSFEALGMFPQARARLDSVMKIDPGFLDVSYRLAKLQAGR